MTLTPIDNSKKIEFLKMNGAGNDFVIIDQRLNQYNLSTQSLIDMCDRNYGIGCDQLITINNSDIANCHMTIFNNDGTTSEACGNATRCVAAIIFNENSTLLQIKIQTIAGILDCKKESNDMISVTMGVPKFNWQDIPLSNKQDTQSLNIYGYNAFCVNIGNPHTVLFLDHKITDTELFNLGPKIENDPIFLNRTNVEFAHITSDYHIKARVWERGVGETQACGSGACAIAAIAIKNKLINTTKTLISYPGGDIYIEWNNPKSPIIMSGDYEIEYEGEYIF
jgi:diaminopimelate epimerase